MLIPGPACTISFRVLELDMWLFMKGFPLQNTTFPYFGTCLPPWYPMGTPGGMDGVTGNPENSISSQPCRVQPFFQYFNHAIEECQE